MSVGPLAAVAGWLLFRTDRGQPTSASFWFAVCVAFGVSLLLGLAATRRLGRSSLWGVVSTLLAVLTWLVWLFVFIGTDPS